LPALTANKFIAILAHVLVLPVLHLHLELPCPLDCQLAAHSTANRNLSLLGQAGHYLFEIAVEWMQQSLYLFEALDVVLRRAEILEMLDVVEIHEGMANGHQKQLGQIVFNRIAEAMAGCGQR